MNEKENPRLRRLIEIRDCIQNEPMTWTCGKLAVRFNVSRPQIYRDVQRLKNNGYNIQSSQKGFFLEDGSESVTPPTRNR